MQSAPDETSEYNYTEDAVSSSLPGFYVMYTMMMSF